MLVMLIAGCGGGDEQAKEPRPARTTAAPAGEAIFHTVANDMRDIGALAAGECANEAAIRRAMGRLRQDAARLPLDTNEGAEANGLVDEVLAEARSTLSSCP